MAASHRKFTPTPLEACQVVRFVGKRGGRVILACLECRQEFECYRSAPRRFCSLKCGAAKNARQYKAARLEKVCENCYKPFEVRPGLIEQQFCSMVCKQTLIARRTANARSVKARAVGAKPTTYRKLHCRHEHRVVAEQKLGRALVPGEIVHHIDGNRHNNAPENLEVMTQSQHARLHSTKNRICSVPGCGRKHAAKGLCMNHWRQGRKRAASR
jgi:hypothetical protein